ncbi:MAG: signal peptidase I [Bacteroidales bacterium]
MSDKTQNQSKDEGELYHDKQAVMLRMHGNSMYPTLQEGDIGIVCKCRPEDLEVGDIVVFKSRGKIVAHRLVKIQDQPSMVGYMTQGDKNLHPDIPFTAEVIEGKITTFQRKNAIKTVNDWSVRRLAFIATHFRRLIIPFYDFALRVRYYNKKLKDSFLSLNKNMKIVGKGTQRQFLKNAFVAVIQGVLPFLLIIFMKLLIDALTNPTIPNVSIWNDQMFLLAMTALMFLLNALITVIKSYYMERLSYSVKCRSYELLQQKHSELDLSMYEDAGQQDQMHRADQEAGFRPVKIMSELMMLIKSLTSLLVMLALFASIQWYLVLLLVIAIVPSVVVQWQYSGKRYLLSKNQSPVEREMGYYNRILTGFPFAKELRLFGYSGIFHNRFLSIEEKLEKDKKSLQQSELKANVFAQLFTVFLIFASLAYLVYLKMTGAITIGSVVLFFFVFQRGFSVFMDLFQSLAKLVEDNTFLNDFMDFLNNPVKTGGIGEKKPPSPLKKGIKVENLRFRYEMSKRDALTSVSLDIPAGKTVAFVGANGSGKTTMIKLLCGFYLPLEGSIRYDDVELKDLNKEALREQITAVFQDFALYNVSANENICLGDVKKPFNPDQAKKAAEFAGIAEVLERLPDGYQTLLGNLFKNGEELSIGQWQKVAIARAFYRDSPIVFMDEPSSALDIDSEKQLLGSLKKLGENKTVVIVSHRMSTVQWADIIYFFENGRILESGSHQELMDKEGAYFCMVQSTREKVL